MEGLSLLAACSADAADTDSKSAAAIRMELIFTSVVLRLYAKRGGIMNVLPAFVFDLLHNQFALARARYRMIEKMKG
jgi:hypothetical protein